MHTIQQPSHTDLMRQQSAGAPCTVPSRPMTGHTEWWTILWAELCGTAQMKRGSFPLFAGARRVTALSRIAKASPDNMAATPPPPARNVPGASVRSLLPTSCRRKKPEPVRASHVALLCHATTVYLGRSDKERETGGRVSTAMPAVRTLSLASRDVAQLTRSRFTPLGYRVNDAQSRSSFAKASFKC